MLFTSHDRRLSRSVMKLRHDLAGPLPAGFAAGTLPWDYPQGHDQINSHGHNRRDGYAAGDDANLYQPDDCLPT